MARISIPGSREAMLDGRGNVNPRWRRFFEEVSGQSADLGDVLVVGSDGPGFGADTSTAAQDAEFLEFWRN